MLGEGENTQFRQPKDLAGASYRMNAVPGVPECVNPIVNV
jgi:hypothetical protein